MTPPDEPASNPNDPSWPKPENPYEPNQPSWSSQESGWTQPAAPYSAPQHQQQYGAPQYGAPQYGAAQASHPSAMTSLILGMIALGGLLVCAGITLPLAPFAWFIGGKTVKEIDANPGRWSGRDQAQAGRIMGIIGTVLLVLGVIAVIAFIGLVFATAPDSGTVYNDSPGTDF